jgi:hypothetical protein
MPQDFDALPEGVGGGPAVLQRTQRSGGGGFLTYRAST